MDYVFYGTPTKKEILIYLKDKEYSLLNKLDLREDIISYNIKRSSHEDSITNTVEDSNIKIVEDRLLDKKISKGEQFSSKELIDIIQGDILEEMKREKKNEKRKITQIKNMVDKTNNINKSIVAITKKNTKKNAGYKTVRLEVKFKTIFAVEELNDKENNLDEIELKEIETNEKRKVKFIEREDIPVHNKDEVVPILLKTSNSHNSFVKPKKIEVIPIESIIYIPQTKLEDSHFIYKKKT